MDYGDIYESSVDYNTYSYTTTGFDGEGQITSAISYVTSENQPILYTLDGHGEKDLDASIREDIEKANIEIRIPESYLQKKACLEDTACLMINHRQQIFLRMRKMQFLNIWKTAEKHDLLRLHRGIHGKL